jgi:AcrR family transcriptional regulator
LRAARKYFAHNYYSEVSVAQLLAESGVKAPTLYHHFGDKEGLYVSWCLAALDQIGSELRAKLAEPVADPLVEGLAYMAGQTEATLQNVESDLRHLSPEGGALVRERLAANVYRPLSAAVSASAHLGDAEALEWAKALAVSVSVHRAHRPLPNHGFSSESWPKVLVAGLKATSQRGLATAENGKAARVD